jgi:small subunit ribosomal protein S2
MTTEEAQKAPAAANVAETKTNSEDFFADFDFGKVEVNLEEMLKNGVHFGHQKSRKNPKMEDYIFTTRKGINILNLEKTAEELEKAIAFLREVRRAGKKVLLVGTKKQVQDLVKSLAKVTDMPFVVERWLGGTFTNFKIIKGRTTYLRDSQDKQEKGEFKKYTKFEQLKKNEELQDMERRMGGIKNMLELPGAIVVCDLITDELAVKEARHKNIPIVAIADTNTNPMNVDYPIPANDDAVSSVRTILGYLGKALLEQPAPKVVEVEKK